MELTTEKARKLTIPAGKDDHVEWDDTLPGFGVRVFPGGRRSWIVQARLNGQSARMTLGTVAKMNYDAARKVAKIALGKIEQGIDPRTEKADRVAAAAVMFGRQTDAYLEGKREKRRARTVYEIEHSLRQHWKTFHGKAITAITVQDVADRLDEIKRDHGPIAANRARSYLSGFFKWAMAKGKMGQRPYNPVPATEKPADETPRDRTLNDAELVAIWNACASDDDHSRIMRLLMLTGQRLKEIGGLQWHEVDIAGRVLNLPPARTKNGRAHSVPLSDDAMEIINSISRPEGRTFVFGRRDTGFSGWGKAKIQLDERIPAARTAKERAKAEPWTPHDIRRTMATRMADSPDDGGLGIQPHIVEAVLNHISGHKAGVAGVYNRARYEAEKRDALDKWNKRVMVLVAQAAGGNIVTLRKA